MIVPRRHFIIDPFRFDGGGGSTGTAWNPSDKAANITLSNSDLTADVPPSEPWCGVRAVASQSTGVRYFELTYDFSLDGGSGGQWMVGVGTSSGTLSNYMGSTNQAWAYQPTQQRRWHNNSGPLYGAATPLAGGEVIGILMNFTTGDLTFYVNGSSQGVAYSGVSGTLFPMLSLANDFNCTARFASGTWTNAPGVGESEW